MANELAPYYLLQCSFAAGEISPEVANRVDLDKYNSAVLKARNCHIRPYGPIYKRPGMRFVARTKYSDKKSIIVPFNGAGDADYLLEIGHEYIRVHKDGQYLGVELATPYIENTLTNLRFTQSADTMFIASGDYPVKQLIRYSDDRWEFSDFEITNMYFDESDVLGLDYGNSYTTPGTYVFKAPASGNYSVTMSGAGGSALVYELKVFNKNLFIFRAAGGNAELIQQTVTLTKDEEYTIVVGKANANYTLTNGAANVEAPSGNPSTAFGLTAAGGGGGKYTYIGEDEEGNTVGEYTAGESLGNGSEGAKATGTPTSNTIDKVTTTAKGGYVRIKYLGNTSITPSGISGDITLTSNKSIFTGKEGAYIKLKHNIASKTISVSTSTTSAKLKVGEQWKIITHGTWTGSVIIERSYDDSEWKEYRKYTAKDDYNVSESGTLTEPMYLRVVTAITSGTCNVDLTAMPYVYEGIVKITSVTSGTEVNAHVMEELGAAEETDNFLWGAWSNDFGYPKTIAFFQDRLVFGGSKAQPYMLWMSRSGDYANFSVEKASGTVTDDSAVAIGLISRKQYQILHLVASSDLIILTAGNEWIISGGDVVTPSNINAKMQTTRGCSDVEPIIIGGRIVFVQGRGSTVRDMGYSFETDSYGGNELTLLSKHIIQGIQIIDAAYKQEPDSTLYMVRSDGTIACLAYIYDQKVYAWSTIDTEGEIEAVSVIQEGDEDSVYVVVKRVVNGDIVRYIECFNNNNNSCTDPDHYIMLDCATKITNTEDSPSSSFNIPSLAGLTINVLADDRWFENIIVDSNGDFSLPMQAVNVIAGLPYTMEIELPNVEIKTGDGTMQGRKKQISGCTLRLSNTLGGEIGNDSSLLDMIPYDENSATYKLNLYSGDKEIALPIGGFNIEGRVLIRSSEPFPFNLLMAVREVSFGG